MSKRFKVFYIVVLASFITATAALGAIVGFMLAQIWKSII